MCFQKLFLKVAISISTVPYGEKLKLRTEKRHVARCVGLARLPTEYIENGYLYVMKKSPKSDTIQKFNKYFKRQWLKKNELLNSCSCAGEKVRTNNNIEGWHSKINRYIGRKYPTLPQLLNVLQTQSTAYELKTATKKNKEYQFIDKEINLAILRRK